MFKFQKMCWIACELGWLSSAHASSICFKIPFEQNVDLASRDTVKGNFNFDASSSDSVPAEPTARGFAITSPFQMTVSIGTRDFGLSIGLVNAGLGISLSGDLTLESFLPDPNGRVLVNRLTLPSGMDFSPEDFHLAGILAGLEVQLDGEVQLDNQLTELGAQDVPEPSQAAFVLTGMMVMLLARSSRNR